MGDTYSLYEAKAKFSQLIRQVREGRTVTVTYRGTPVAEIRPPEPKQETIEDRLAYLRETGQITPARGRFTGMKPIAVIPGALERFLADRSRF